MKILQITQPPTQPCRRLCSSNRNSAQPCCRLCSWKYKSLSLHNLETGCVAVTQPATQLCRGCVGFFNRLSENILTAYKRSFSPQKRAERVLGGSENIPQHSWGARNTKTSRFHKIQARFQRPISDSCWFLWNFSSLRAMNCNFSAVTLFSAVLRMGNS